MMPATTQPQNQEGFQSTFQPVRKVTAGAFTGALITFIVLILNSYHPFFQQQKNQISGEISGAATTILAFIVSYVIPPSSKEVIINQNNGATKSARTI